MLERGLGRRTVWPYLRMVGLPMVTHAVARRSVQHLQLYFAEQGFSDDVHASLDACSDLIYSRAHANTILDSFFPSWV